MDGPMPIPSTNSQLQRGRLPVVAVSWVISNSPTVRIAIEPTKRALYLPVRAISNPAPTLVAIKPNSRGQSM